MDETTDTDAIIENIVEHQPHDWSLVSLKVREAVEALAIEPVEADWDALEVTTADAERITEWVLGRLA